MLNDHYFRLGLLRSTVTMGLPNFYGNMCILVLPLILYMYELEKKSTYIIMASLDLLAVIHSGCRSDMFFFFIILFINAIIVILSKPRKTAVFVAYGYMLLIVSITITILSISSPYYKYYYEGTGKALLNEVGFDFDLDENAPEDVAGYGVNDGKENGDGGVNSRISQFPSVLYTMHTNPLFGLGNGVLARGDLLNWRNGQWIPSYTYDVGYIEIICNEGLIGLAGFISLLAYVVLSIRKMSDSAKKFLALAMISYALCLLSATNMFTFLFLYIAIISIFSEVKD